MIIYFELLNNSVKHKFEYILFLGISVKVKMKSIKLKNSNKCLRKVHILRFRNRVSVYSSVESKLKINKKLTIYITKFIKIPKIFLKNHF